MRLLADENFSAKVASRLRSLGHDVRLVAKATSDSVVVSQAKAESRVLLTHDTDFADETVYPPSSHCGVMLIRINSMHADKIQSAIVKTMSQIHESKWEGKLVFVFEDASLEYKAGRFVPLP